MKIIGVIPARMAASRFPGKPLHSIAGRPMLEHVILRSKLYTGWSELLVATCDEEIISFCKDRGHKVFMTGAHHERALDRVAEVVSILGSYVDEDDIIVCVQGDEPMLRPDMIDAVLKPLLDDPNKSGTILSMHITEESIWNNPDTVKIIHNASGEVLYTSRSPLPYAKNGFSVDLMARRIYGIFAFRASKLMLFTQHPQTRLEKLEACDSNRILDMNFRQHIAPYKHIKSYSVDSFGDIELVEKNIIKDEIWGSY